MENIYSKFNSGYPDKNSIKIIKALYVLLVQNKTKHIFWFILIQFNLLCSLQGAKFKFHFFEKNMNLN